MTEQILIAVGIVIVVACQFEIVHLLWKILNAIHERWPVPEDEDEQPVA
jgi:hypothetical protein